MAGVRAIGLSWLCWICFPVPLPAHALLDLTLNLLEFGQPPSFASHRSSNGSELSPIGTTPLPSGEAPRHLRHPSGNRHPSLGRSGPHILKVTERMENLAPVFHPVRGAESVPRPQDDRWGVLRWRPC